MNQGFDDAAVARAAQGLSLWLPRVPHRGRIGDERSASVGASMEMHDFRMYQPGDDLRHVDWNAVARTGELILRVRQDEVAPRVEVIVDGSRSMALSEVKARRTKEVAALVCEVSRRQGLEPTLFLAGAKAERVFGPGITTALHAYAFEGADDLMSALKRAPPLRRAGLRIVISDFLFEAPLERFAETCARETTGTHFVQVLDAEDVDPSGGFGARLVDAESEAGLDRILSPAVLRRYLERLEAHQRLLQAAAHRVRGSILTGVTTMSLDELVRGPYAPMFDAGSAHQARVS